MSLLLSQKVSMNFLYQKMNEQRNTLFLETNEMKSKKKGTQNNKLTKKQHVELLMFKIKQIFFIKT